MELLDWFTPLEDCTTLGEIRARWTPLLEERHLYAGNESPQYRDAMLVFLARSALPANLKMGAVLSCVQPWDLDLRLAIGALSPALEPFYAEWPETNPAASFACSRLSFGLLDDVHDALLNGRLTGLRDTLPHDHCRIEDWTAAFWSQFLVLSCRWADADGVRLALAHGANIDHDGQAAVRCAAEGTHANFRSAYYRDGRTHADYCRIIDLLLAAVPDTGTIAAAASCAAAAADNEDMLAYLVSAGIDIHADDDAALTAAAGHMAVSTVEWLLGHGADVHAGNEAALLAAVGSLDLTTVEVLLDAGADLHVDDERPLRTALDARPVDLYCGEEDFVIQRADMVALLAGRGASAGAPAVKAGLRAAPQAAAVVEWLRDHCDLAPDTRAAIESALPPT